MIPEVKARVVLAVAEAKAHFSECLEAALKEGHVVITRHGKPIAVIVDIEYLVQLQRLRAAREGEELAELASGWQNADEFAQVLDKTVQDRHGWIPEQP